MKRLYLAAAIIIFAAAGALSQEASFRPSGSYLIPQTIYVGDRSRLVVPLDDAFSRLPAFVSAVPDELIAYSAPDLIISRIELDHRSGNPRLYIDFVPYITGTIPLPAIIIPDKNGLEITGLRVNVASILQPHDASLAGLAAPLAAPGTGFIIYSALAAVLIIFLFCVFAAIWYKNHFTEFKKRMQRRRLLKAMSRLIMQLKMESHEGENQEELFSILSREFREFLSMFTGIDCRALTPAEFTVLQLPESEFFGSGFLFETFSRWENIRFGGTKLANLDFIVVLDETNSFITGLEAAERNVKRAS